MTKRPIAIIPARGGSKRVPRKNIVDIEGKPMMAYPIETCLMSGLFSEVIVSTEDTEIASIAQECGAFVDARPDELAADSSPVTLTCRQLLENRYIERDRPESFCLVYPMAIFLESKDLEVSLKEFDGCDGVLGVSQYAVHPYKALTTVDGFASPVWPDQNKQQSQKFPEMYCSNGTFIWCRSSSFVGIENPTFYPTKLKLFDMPFWKAVDIDTPQDLEFARRLKSIDRS